jgi:hypothetical protein
MQWRNNNWLGETRRDFFCFGVHINSAGTEPRPLSWDAIVTLPQSGSIYILVQMSGFLGGMVECSWRFPSILAQNAGSGTTGVPFLWLYWWRSRYTHLATGQLLLCSFPLGLLVAPAVWPVYCTVCEFFPAKYKLILAQASRHPFQITCLSVSQSEVLRLCTKQ